MNSGWNKTRTDPFTVAGVAAGVLTAVGLGYLAPELVALGCCAQLAGAVGGAVGGAAGGAAGAVFGALDAPSDGNFSASYGNPDETGGAVTGGPSVGGDGGGGGIQWSDWARSVGHAVNTFFSKIPDVLNPEVASAFASGASQGFYAALDGANPFGKPFANRGFYDANDSTLQISQKIGEYTRDAELTIAGGGALPAASRFTISATKIGQVAADTKYIGAASKLFGRVYRGVGTKGWLNRGPVRLGWGWDGTKGVFRFSVGSKTDIKWIEHIRHVDF